MSSSFDGNAGYGMRGSRGIGTAAWVAGIATLAVVSSVSLVDARPAPASSEVLGPGHLTVSASVAAKAEIAGAYKVAARGRKILKGAAIGAGTRRNRDDKDQNEAQPDANEAQAELPASGGPQPIAAPPKPEVARAPVPEKRQEPTGLAAHEGVGCVVNCTISADLRRRAGGQQQNANNPAPATALAGGLECIANCGDSRGSTRAASTMATTVSGGEMRPTTSEGDGRIKILRGVTRSKVYSVR